MEAPVVAIVDQPEAADVDGIIDDLMAFNRIHAPALEQLRIVSLARVGERVVGGAIVFEYGGWAELAVLWVDEQQRGHGLGSRLVGVIEDDLRRRGFAGMHTDTFSFQALPFYEKLGFHVFGRIEGFVDGNTRYYLEEGVPMKAVHVYVTGRVQGVWYRASTQREAQHKGLAGWVRNRRDGRVEAWFEGDAAAVDALVRWCHEGPELARVFDVEVAAVEPEGFRDFEVRATV